jgi:hypothetical protein
VRVAAVGVVALVAAVVLEWSPLVPASVALVGGAYATHLALDDPPLDVHVAALAALLLLAVELAHWSLEEADDVSTDPGEAWRRLAVVVGFGAVALVVAAGVLALVDAVRTRGLAVDLLGAAAAAAALLALVLAGRGGTASR